MSSLKKPPSGLIDTKGRPLQSNFGFSGADYNSGSRSSRELGCWQPQLKSADRSMLPEKDATEGRARDLIRNNGFAKGALQNSKDRIVGSYYRLQLRPRYKLLGIDQVEAQKWATEVEQRFHAWADDPECYVDARRQMTFTQLLRESVGMDLMHGEAFMSREWKPNNSGYSTCFLTIEPERVKTPPQFVESTTLRGGVSLDSYGEAMGYYIRTQHQYDVGFNQFEKYDFKPKKNEFGWTNIIHVFERDLPNQTRGFSPFASVIKKLKMMDRLEDTELEASIMAATYAMVLTSDAGSAVFDSLSGGEDINDGSHPLAQFAIARDGFNSSSPLQFDGVRVPQLFPNDKLEMINPNHPNNVFAEFEAAMLRHIARGFGMSYEELSGDYTKTTYSSARAAMQISWEYVKGRREAIASKMASLIFRSWLDEAIVKGIVSTPVDYWANRSFWTYCDWVGAGRLIIDDVKAQTANKVAFENNTGTLAKACAEQGEDWEETLLQRKFEQDRMTELGLSSASMPIQVIIQDGQANEQV